MTRTAARPARGAKPLMASRTGVLQGGVLCRACSTTNGLVCQGSYTSGRKYFYAYCTECGFATVGDRATPAEALSDFQASS